MFVYTLFKENKPELIERHTKGVKQMNIKGHYFLEELASLCDKYQATLSCSQNDGGISIELNYEEVFCGPLYDNPSDELRYKIKENTTNTEVKPDLDCKIEEFYEDE
tara:strand:+ start:191 stop:511 length:321 start_codon:yes stop_codon:yes gene_type:complete